MTSLAVHKEQDLSRNNVDNANDAVPKRISSNFDTENQLQWKVGARTVEPSKLSKYVTERKTATKLSLQRKLDKRPDATFDLTGDGNVSQREFFVASKFDKDRDGKLNADEKKAALDALKDGSFERTYVFGLERAGAQTVGNATLQAFTKIVQKGGAVGRADELYQSAEKAKPSDLLYHLEGSDGGKALKKSKSDQRFSTRTDMLLHRKKMLHEDSKKQHEALVKRVELAGQTLKD